MELLQRISKKYLFLSFAMLMVTMGVVSCDCGGGVESETGKLELSFEKEQLQALDKKTKLSIKATKATKLTGLKLVAKLTSNTPAAGKVKLTVGGTDHEVTIGKDFHPSLHDFLALEAGGELTEGEEKSVGITFEPTTEKDLTLVVEVKSDQNEVVGSAKTVEWQDKPAVVLEAVSDKVIIIDKDLATITVTNNSGVDVNPKEVEVILNATDGATFDLSTLKGKGDNAAQSLEAIIGNNNAITAGGKVTFTIRLDAAGAAKTSDLSLTMKHNGKTALPKTKVVEWKDKSVVVLEAASDKVTITDKESATITLTNKSGVDVTPNEVEVTLNATNGATFDLGAGTAKGDNATQTLGTILGNNTLISVGGKVTFTIQLNAAGAGKTSEISLTMKHNGKTALAKKKVVEWKDKSVVVLEVASDKSDIFHKEEATVTVTNNSGVAVNPSEVEVILNVTNGATFDLNTAIGKGDNATQTLEAILGNNTAITAAGKVTFTIKLKAAGVGKNSEISLTMKHNGKTALAKKRVVEWKAVALGLVSDKNITASEEATITVTNNSRIAVTPSHVQVVLNVDNDSEFVLGGAGAKKNAENVTLDAILGRDTPINAGSSVTFKVKLSDAKGKKKSALSFTLNHDGLEAFATAKVVEWKAVALEVASDKNIEGLEEATITVTNNSGVTVTPSDVAVVLNVDNDSEFVLGAARAKKDKDNVTLEDILGNDTAINAGGKATFKVKLSDAKGKKKSTLSFTLNHDKLEAFAKAKVVEWKTVALGLATDKNIEGLEEATITVTNNSGVTVTPSEVEVVLNVNNNSAFLLGAAGAGVDGDNVTLEAILGNNTAINAAGKVTFKVTLSDPKANKKSALSFTLFHNGLEAFSTPKVVEWKAVALGMVRDKDIVGAGEAIITVVNNSGVSVASADIEVIFNVDNDSEFVLGAAGAKKEADSVTLEAILGSNATINIGGKVTFKVKLSDDKGNKKSTLSFTLNHQGIEAFATAKVVEWKES